MFKEKYFKEALNIEPRILQADVDLLPIMDIKRDTAFISGSVVEGFGNSSSDVDLYILSDKNPMLPNGIKFGYTNTDGGYYNEVIVYHYDYVDEV
jgi:predicted nucleotidyltransferase